MLSRQTDVRPSHEGNFANGAATAAFASLVSSAASAAKTNNLNNKYKKLLASTDPADRQKAIDLAVDHFKINTDGVDSIRFAGIS